MKHPAYKLSAYLLIATLLVGVLAFTRSTKAAWLTGYSYRKAITITGQSGAGTNYQVKLSIGASTGGNFNLGGHATNFPNDIAFTDNDETTELDYWIEDTAADPITVWVEVLDTLDSNATIYIYYGKTGDTDSSNGDNTFLFFDDFNDGSINSSKWTQEITSGTITESSGYLRSGGGSTSAPYGHTSLGSSPGFTGFATSTAARFRSRAASNGIGEFVFRGVYASNIEYKVRIDQRTGQGFSYLSAPFSGWNFVSGCANAGTPPTADTWYIYDLTVSSFTGTLYQNGSSVRSCTSLPNYTSGEIALQNHYGSYTDWDWVAVRKFVSTEPAYSSASDEETPPVATPEIPLKINNGKIRLNNGRLILNGT